MSRVYVAGAFEYDTVDLTGQPVPVANMVYETYPEHRINQPMLGEEARDFYRNRADIVACYVSGSILPEPPLRSGDVWRSGDPVPDTGRYSGYEVSSFRREYADKVQRRERFLTPRGTKDEYGHLAAALEQRLGRTGLSIIVY